MGNTNFIGHLVDQRACRTPNNWTNMEVAVQYGIYHDPAKLDCTQGMELKSEDDAYYDGAVPCSACFVEQNGNQYEHEYLRDPINVPVRGDA